MSLLWHHFCNGLGPPLSDIVLFGLTLEVFKTCLLRRGFQTLIKSVSFSSLIDERSHNSPPFRAQRLCWHSFFSPIDLRPPPNPPPFRAQRPYWHTTTCLPLWGTASSLAHRLVSGSDTICNGPGSLLADIVLFGLSLLSFPFRASPQGY